MSGTNEVRTVNAATGGEKGVKDERFDLLPAGPLAKIARHFGIGARKYADRNWERGYEWSKSYGALQRHLNAFWAGEDIDEETQSPHLAAAAFHVLALLEFAETHPELDDRPKRSSADVRLPSGTSGRFEGDNLVELNGFAVGDKVRLKSTGALARIALLLEGEPFSVQVRVWEGMGGLRVWRIKNIEHAD